MRLEDGETSKNTIVGTILTVMLFLTLGMYAYQKTVVLYEKKDVDILSTVNDMHFTYED